MYEHRKQPLLTRKQFAMRVVWHVAVAVGTIALALLAGVLGYHTLGQLPWIDSLLNASMILGGMGPVDPLHTDAAKIFASLYALFSGLVFIGILGMLLAPFVHRLMHKFHIDEEGN
jgi:hypothetical protein